MSNIENPLILEIEALKLGFLTTTDKLIKDIQRHDKIMARADKRQKQDYDENDNDFEDVESVDTVDE